MPHYCKICQTYKADEKFSGKGHKSHICKACKGKSLPKKEKSIKPIKNPFMKAIKIIEVITFEFDPRILILFKRGSSEYVAYRDEYNRDYVIFQFNKKEEHFELTTIFDNEMARHAIETKSNYVSVIVAEWDDFKDVSEHIETYEQTLENENSDNSYSFHDNNFVEHYYECAKEHEKSLLLNLYKLQVQIPQPSNF